MAINCRNPIINYLIFLYFNKILVNKYSEIIKLSIEFK